MLAMRCASRTLNHLTIEGTADAPLPGGGRHQRIEWGHVGGTVATAWNKEQAGLLRHIALAGGSCAFHKCQGPALDALIEAGFVSVQLADRVALTDAGLARARELRSP